MKMRTYSLVFITLSILAMLVTAGFNYYVDPFTYYHQPWTAINLSKNQRFSNPGLARQFDYRSVLVGTSHVQELESSRLSEIISEPAINLSLNAGLIGEQVKLIDLVLRVGKAESVLWEMNFPSFSNGVSLSKAFPEYLYSPVIDTPFRYLLSYDTLTHSLKALRNPHNVTLDNRNQIAPREFSAHRVRQNWNFEMRRWDASELRQIWAELQRTIEQPQEVVEALLIPLVTAHPDVTFKLFLPPGTVLLFLLQEATGPNDFERWLAWRDLLGEFTDQYPNVELHDFQADFELADNLDLFRDIEHFNRNVLENIFLQISEGTHRVNLAAVQRNTRRLRRHVKAYGKRFCVKKANRCTGPLKYQLGLNKAKG